MKKQITDTIMMIRPKNFGFNEETAKNNAFQSKEMTISPEEISAKALQEFDHFVNTLREVGVKVEVIEDTDSPKKPDAVFPNNWISFHQDGKVITYPMFSKIRRKERREEIIEMLSKKYKLPRRYSFEYYEEEDFFLEGTGSMVLDRLHSIAYACRSIRTDVHLLDKWAILNDYVAVIFDAVDRNNLPIYHTNVMMALGESFVIICMESVKDKADRQKLISTFHKTGKDIIEINYRQMEKFAGNMLQVKGRDKNYLVMSKQAFQSLSEEQIHRIKTHTEILYTDISTIETFGGGSVRCMMAELFY